eukprot:COSAG06_NODE_51682_length_310_cov_1.222749_1_plen_78_part_10
MRLNVHRQTVVNLLLEKHKETRVKVLLRPGSAAAEGGLQHAFPQAVRFCSAPLFAFNHCFPFFSTFPMFVPSLSWQMI